MLFSGLSYLITLISCFPRLFLSFFFFFWKSQYVLYNFLTFFLSFSAVAIESFSKLGDSIYFEEEGKDPGLYIIQYIPSSFDWKSGQILLILSVEPVVSWDHRLQVTLTIFPKEVSIVCYLLPEYQGI